MKDVQLLILMLLLLAQLTLLAEERRQELLLLKHTHTTCIVTSLSLSTHKYTPLSAKAPVTSSEVTEGGIESNLVG